MNCACGKPLHYFNKVTQRQVEQLTADLGEYIDIVVGDKKYRVQRHFIALHGIAAADLDRLVEEGIVLVA